MDNYNFFILKEKSCYAQNGVNGSSVGTSGPLSLCPCWWCLFVFVIGVACFLFIVAAVAFICSFNFAIKMELINFNNELKYSRVENLLN